VLETVVRDDLPFDAPCRPDEEATRRNSPLFEGRGNRDPGEKMSAGSAASEYDRLWPVQLGRGRIWLNRSH
jgi:hypothetical protein